MNKIKVEMDLLPNALTEVIPGLSVHSELGEKVKLTVEIESASLPKTMGTAAHPSGPNADRTFVRGLATFDSSAEKPSED